MDRSLENLWCKIQTTQSTSYAEQKHPRRFASRWYGSNTSKNSGVKNMIIIQSTRTEISFAPMQHDARFPRSKRQSLQQQRRCALHLGSLVTRHQGLTCLELTDAPAVRSWHLIDEGSRLASLIKSGLFSVVSHQLVSVTVSNPRILLTVSPLELFAKNKHTPFSQSTYTEMGLRGCRNPRHPCSICHPGSSSFHPEQAICHLSVFASVVELMGLQHLMNVFLALQETSDSMSRWWWKATNVEG